jgi:xylulokinase
LRRAYLSIDVGTSAVKAGVIDPTGRMLGSAAAGYELTYGAGDRVEANPETYWRAVVGAAREALSRGAAAAGGPLQLAAVATCSQGETLICLDRERRPIGPAIVWLDNRACREAAELGASVTADELYARTGQLESIATWPAAKLLWLRRHDLQRFDATAVFALLGDWIGFRLCGELAAEITLNSSSLLLDIGSREWWDDALTLVGIDPQQLPPLVETGTVLGSLTGEASSALGVPARTPVIAGTLDQVAAALGAGNVWPGTVTETTGTVLALATTIVGLAPARSSGIPMYLHTRPDRLCALPYAQTSGLVLDWLERVFHGSESDRRDYGSLVAEAEAIAPGADGVTFLPHLAGAAFPEFDLEASGAIIGLRLRHGRAHIIRAALEAAAYTLRRALGALERAGVRPQEVISLGGAARNDAWCQMKADACGLPIRRIRCREASLLGVAMLAAVASGDHADEDIAVAAMTQLVDAAEPDPTRAAAYEDGYHRYLALGEQLAALRQHSPAQSALEVA